jgi:hypothetical protein
MREYVNEAYDKTIELLRAQAEITVQREGARRTAAYLRRLQEQAERAKREKLEEMKGGWK